MHTWEITAGKLYDPSGGFVSKGYAGGNCGKNPEGIDNADLCNIAKVGPLPPGDYTLGTPVEHSKLGPFAIPLTPDPANEMFGRSDFYVHGDTTPSGRASEGCIILPRMVRDRLHTSPDQKLRVVRAK